MDNLARDSMRSRYRYTHAKVFRSDSVARYHPHVVRGSWVMCGCGPIMPYMKHNNLKRNQRKYYRWASR